jgi:hypothetical protein
MLKIFSYPFSFYNLMIFYPRVLNANNFGFLMCRIHLLAAYIIHTSVKKTSARVGMDVFFEIFGFYSTLKVGSGHEWPR